MKGCYEALLTHSLHNIHILLYLPLKFRVAYIATGNYSENLTITWEIDHHTGNYIT